MSHQNRSPRFSLSSAFPASSQHSLLLPDFLTAAAHESGILWLSDEDEEEEEEEEEAAQAVHSEEDDEIDHKASQSAVTITSSRQQLTSPGRNKNSSRRGSEQQATDSPFSSSSSSPMFSPSSELEFAFTLGASGAAHPHSFTQQQQTIRSGGTSQTAPATATSPVVVDDDPSVSIPSRPRSVSDLPDPKDKAGPYLSLCCLRAFCVSLCYSSPFFCCSFVFLIFLSQRLLR